MRSEHETGFGKGGGTLPDPLWMVAKSSRHFGAMKQHCVCVCVRWDSQQTMGHRCLFGFYRVIASFQGFLKGARWNSSIRSMLLVCMSSFRGVTHRGIGSPHFRGCSPRRKKEEERSDTNTPRSIDNTSHLPQPSFRFK